MIKKIMMKQYFPTLKKDETEGVMSELEAEKLMSELKPMMEIDGTLCDLYTCPRCGRKFYLDANFSFFVPPTCGECESDCQ